MPPHEPLTAEDIGFDDPVNSTRDRTAAARLERAIELKSVPDPEVFNLTDSGNAEYFATVQGANVRFDHRRKRWLIWQGNRWRPDPDEEIRRRAKDAMRMRQTDAFTINDPDQRKAAMKWALSSESRARLVSLLDLARAEDPIADAGDAWDADPWIMAAKNGVIDLRTGELRTGRREDRVTMATAVSYDAEATCPRWDRFTLEVFGGNAELASFLQRAIGYSMTGETSEQCLFMAYGTGSNGKTTALQTTKSVVGEYAYNMPFSTIEMYQRSNIPNDVAALVNRRFVIASETTDGARLNESRIKALTGCDAITARFLHQEYFTFEPVAKFWLSVNHKPVVRDDSHGFWRRIRLIPFNETFPVNPGLADELQAEAPGILAWAVRGCLAWQQQGLDPPAVVTEATAEYERESDPLGAFLDESCHIGDGFSARAGALYGEYSGWAERQKFTRKETLTNTAFGRKMSERFEKEKDTSSGCMVYHGIGLREGAR